MSRKSKSKGGSTGYKAVPQATQEQADKALGGIMDKQSSFLTSLLGPLVERGEAMMAENPGFKNFTDKVGQTKDKVDNALLGPGSLLSQLDDALGIERNPQPDVAAPNPATPFDRREAMSLGQPLDSSGVFANGQNQDYINSLRKDGQAPFDINNYMRNQFKL
jgi:hypothetical protein